jgi:hypothetical protein
MDGFKMMEAEAWRCDHMMGGFFVFHMRSFHQLGICNARMNRWQTLMVNMDTRKMAIGVSTLVDRYAPLRLR